MKRILIFFSSSILFIVSCSVPEGDSSIPSPQLTVAVVLGTNPWTSTFPSYLETTSGVWSDEAVTIVAGAVAKSPMDLRDYDAVIAVNLPPTDAASLAGELVGGPFLAAVEWPLSDKLVDLSLRLDHRRLGGQAAHFLIDELGGEGIVAVLEAPDLLGLDERIIGFETVIAGYPGIDLVVPPWNVDSAAGLVWLEEQVLAGTTIDGLYVHFIGDEVTRIAALVPDGAPVTGVYSGDLSAVPRAGWTVYPYGVEVIETVIHMVVDRLRGTAGEVFGTMEVSAVTWSPGEVITAPPSTEE